MVWGCDYRGGGHANRRYADLFPLQRYRKRYARRVVVGAILPGHGDGVHNRRVRFRHH